MDNCEHYIEGKDGYAMCTLEKGHNDPHEAFIDGEFVMWEDVQ